MKKFVAAAILLVFLLCGCSVTQKGAAGELTKYSWSAKTEGGGELHLYFNGGNACLALKNSGKSTEIKGRFLADETVLVIFDEELKQNYGFNYVPKGEKLELEYEGNTIEFSADENVGE